MNWQTHGFESIKAFFEKAAESGQLSHAYMFTGQEMIGKYALAQELCALINGHANLLDRYTIDAGAMRESSIAIEEIRRAKGFLSLRPQQGPYKFLIVNNADQMTVEAQNSFLKELEDSRPASIIFLITAYPDQLLPTIRSRCQEISCPSHSQETIKAVLSQEKVPTEKREFLANFCNGRLGLALDIARNDRYAELKKVIQELADLKKAPLYKRLKIAQVLSEAKDIVEVKTKLLYWTLYLHMDQALSNAPTLERLAGLSTMLDQPQYNRRLVLDKYLIQL